jgi:peptidoglycan/LPS O-acetylase OafA/YrhL
MSKSSAISNIETNQCSVQQDVTRAPIVVEKEADRLLLLDGWRGLSILLVLATHLLPLGPKQWQVNEAAGPMGMNIFFILSGFLITNFLYHHDSTIDFLIRRFFRIVPLAWTSLTVALLVTKAPYNVYLPHFLFYGNFPPFPLQENTAHFWSLCVEMQFYLAIALVFRVLRKNGLLLIPIFCLLVTGLRIYTHTYISIVTYLRLDEILVGGTLALIYNNALPRKIEAFLEKANSYLFLVLFILACFPQTKWLNYFRPYFAGILVGSTLFNKRSFIRSIMEKRWLGYIGAISYALYVFHPLLVYSWLGEGTTFIKYLKRPLLFGVLFLMAHLSTFQFEHRCIALGKKLSKRLTGGHRASLLPPSTEK